MNTCETNVLHETFGFRVTLLGAETSVSRTVRAYMRSECGTCTYRPSFTLRGMLRAMARETDSATEHTYGI